MEIGRNVSLANYSTMRLGGIADYLVAVRSRAELKETYTWARQQGLHVIMIGCGSNIVWKDEGFKGLVMVNRITGYDEYVEDARSHYVTIGAGEPWDSVVARSVAGGLSGIEALSLIPGTAGATPIQNVGAYGQEIAQTLTTVEAYDTTTGELTNIPTEACGFGYRKSNFQTEYRGRFFITAITLHLNASNPTPPYYGAVEQYLQQQGIRGTVTPQIIRDAVIAIRSAKLPDPSKVANSGSFFANPIISEDQLTQLRSDFPDMPYWPVDGGGAKIPAAWLIEQAGFKDYHDAETGMATWATQPLVLVNEKATSTADLLSFRDKIITTVAQKFDITLRQEPELLPQ
ncbi:MAG: UDP-N-acetylmuramate dehydrogenase [Candidatus Saccharimonadales bacterium]